MSGKDSVNGLKQPLDVPLRASSAPAERREVESTALLAGGRELLIRHAGETYKLRQTSKGKLILTK